MSRATSLVAVAQQVSIAAGVAIGALAVDLTLWRRGRSTITAADFQPAFIAIALISACAFFVFVRLPADAGAELARRHAGAGARPTEATDQKLRRLSSSAKSRRQQIELGRVRAARGGLDVLDAARNRA